MRRLPCRDITQRIQIQRLNRIACQLQMTHVHRVKSPAEYPGQRMRHRQRSLAPASGRCSGKMAP